MDTVARIGKPAPDFALPDLDGKLHRLSEQRGVLVVLNFWSANCPWSQVGDEILAGMDLLKGENVRLWSIAANVDVPPEHIRVVAAERGIPLVLRDVDQSVIDQYEATTTPQVFLIDAEGVLRYKGAIDDSTFHQRIPTKQYLHDALSALIEGRHPDPEETPAYGCAVVRYIAE
ncbi:MAG: redoxin domain-containing protein [Anaerolineales bacterium]|nr:redoxin domain-containing protein [Anaerolineales bacterium]